MQDKLLNGWKEIGSYLGRTTRTAQRWEAQLNMPIHRPATKKRTAVVAFSRELDAWLARNRIHLEECEENNNTVEIAALHEKLSRLQTEAAQLALELRQAREKSVSFYEPGGGDGGVLPHRQN